MTSILANFKLRLLGIILLTSTHIFAQQQINGRVKDTDGNPIDFADVVLENSNVGTQTDANGYFELSNIPLGEQTLSASFLGFTTVQKTVTVSAQETAIVNFTLNPAENVMSEIVVTGTMKPVTRLNSAVPVEIYSPTFLKKNPTPNIYEALQNVNGVRPQLNCQVCNTGDIHINGLEGPYTMVLIDGMPIVSSLATVYGLSGIPNSIIERVEVVKGPASSLYGSEAIGGLINIITKKTENAPILSADIMGTTWQEWNTDLGAKFHIGKNISVLNGINAYWYDNIIDNNKDNFTDVTQQKRVSLFQKWNFNTKNNRIFTLAGRYYWEDRWGGETQWTKADKGGTDVYGEAITTKRWELIGQYELMKDLLFSVSLNQHDQNSAYGDTPYIAQQQIGFGQLTWGKTWKKHDFLAGTALRYTFYDDNTPATGGDSTNPNNKPDEIWLPGVFVQDEISFSEKHSALLGLRYDYNKDHGHIFTPRLAYKWAIHPTSTFRLNAGTGFRVINLFTEDHAALTGARDIVIEEELQPEQSYNINLNFIKKIYLENGGSGSIELSSWYTYFDNIILPDYETNANQIIYKNIEDYAISKGISLNADLSLHNGFSFLLGATLMDVSKKEDGVLERQLLTEQFSATWTVSYAFWNKNLTVDYTGNLYSPMKLPLLGDSDPRPANSPWWSIQNIQLTYKGLKDFEIYGGVKNLLNWTPWKNQDAPIIARSFDPFDKDVNFDTAGNVIASPNNPNALSFDPTYVYAPNQGIRGFLGIRYKLK